MGDTGCDEAADLICGPAAFSSSRVSLRHLCPLPLTFPLLRSFFPDASVGFHRQHTFSLAIRAVSLAAFVFALRLRATSLTFATRVRPSLVLQPRPSPLELRNRISVQLHLHQPLSPPTVPAVSPLGSLRLCSAVKLAH